MQFISVAASALAVFVGTVYGAPTLQGRAVTTVSTSDLSSLAPFTQFARAAYCLQGSSKWNCGAACSANADFQITLSGGDGNGVQFYYVGWSPSQNSIIVAHEGTDPIQFVSDLTDFNILTDNLASSLFPGVSSSVLVHDGFRNEHALTAPAILKEVKRLMTAKNTVNIATVGHSLGGALALLDALFFTVNIPNASVKSITYGTPRVGNSAFAKLIDAKVPNFKRVDNQDDIVPIVPGRSLGFAHPHGELHILSAGKAVLCPGDDDASDSQCQIQSVPNIFAGNVLDHLGPYEGIHIGTLAC